jgi:2-oxoglutarate ferredoxin oxidoreductase subunit alpha
VALGAISAGLQYAAIYPMSPISNILHVLAENQEKFGFVYKQPEDEISAINMAIGASYAGARSKTATSGGGFCLMTESYGLAGMTETPLVIIDGMRPGPATGLPTWSDQGDLQMILNAHQGDFPRIVLAAGDAKEAFDLTMQAFNLADKYQTPVVLIIDKDICENDQSFQFFDFSSYKIDRGKFSSEFLSEYQRYKYSEDGISQRTVPGIGNYFCANSDEHDQIGYSTENTEIRNKMMEKRMTKLKTCEEQDMGAPQLYGPENADITIISWGSNKGSILQALKVLRNVNFIHISWVSPFPVEALTKMVSKSKYILNIESNYTGHMARLIREKTKIEINDSLLKYDGRQIYSEEIVEKINTLKKNSALAKGGKK